MKWFCSQLHWKSTNAGHIVWSVKPLLNMKKGFKCFCLILRIFFYCNRFKGKSRMMPTVPNQPSEAIAHFMFELSKTVLGKAGGNSSTSLFTQPTNTNTTTGPHRNLHICAFQIGVYALGLNNCVSPNWLSRTYSSHVSWITGMLHDWMHIKTQWGHNDKHSLFESYYIYYFAVKSNDFFQVKQ